MTMRSKGNSKIIGAASAAMTPLDSRTRNPCGVAMKTMTNRTIAAVMVTSAMGSAGGALAM
jgi:hypothetical protein